MQGVINIIQINHQFRKLNWCSYAEAKMAEQADIALKNAGSDPFVYTDVQITENDADTGYSLYSPELIYILDEVKLAGTSVREQWQKRISMTLAADMAIPYGKHLAEKECRKLIEDLFTLEQYKMAPDGKTIMFLMQDEEIKKHF